MLLIKTDVFIYVGTKQISTKKSDLVFRLVWTLDMRRYTVQLMMYKMWVPMNERPLNTSSILNNLFTFWS